MKETIKVLIAGIHFKPSVQFLKAAMPDASVEMVEIDNLKERIHDCDILIPVMTTISEPLLVLAKNLRLIQQWGAGLEGVDIQAASRHGVAVANVPTEAGNADSVAEWCIMAALCLSRSFPRIQQQVFEAHPWGSPAGQSLSGRTAGLIGFGGIGKALASRLRPFGIHMVGVKRTPDQTLKHTYGLDWLEDMKALPRLLEMAEYLFLCIPLTRETKGLIGHRELSMLPAGAFLINPSRGPIVNRNALSDALQSGRLGGAALDVFWKEPPDPADPLLEHPHVLTTPHIAGVTDVSYQQIAAHVTKNIQRIMAGEIPSHCVNPEALTNSRLKSSTDRRTGVIPGLRRS